MQLHTQRYPRRIQDFPHILRLTRVLLQSKDLSMWFCLPLCMWVSGLGSNSVEIAPEKRSPRTTFPPGGKRSSQEAEQASLLRASRGSQLFLGRKAMTNLDSVLKNRHYFADKGPSSQSYSFSSGHVWMRELDYKES